MIYNFYKKIIEIASYINRRDILVSSNSKNNI